ncbi:MAG: metal ABC transporter permease [Candidatus Moraniibacteriota bacterium]
MTIIQFFQFDFLVKALEAGVILSIIAPIVGMFLVVRRYSLLADALAHVSLLGVALALLLNIPVFIGALCTTVLAALGMERLRIDGKVFGEAIIALFLSSSLALSIVIISAAKGLNANLLSYLFGSLTTVRTMDVLILAVLALVIIAFLFLYYRELFLFALDEDLARVSGIRVGMISTVFVLLAAVTVTAAFSMVGVLLIGALMVVPVLAAMQLRLGFRSTLFFSVLFSLFSVLTGFVLAYQFDLASGGAIVIVAVLLFVILYFFRRFRG